MITLYEHPLSAYAMKAKIALLEMENETLREDTMRRTEEEALKRAKAEKKPLLIDFGASWCKACNELEEQTWPNKCIRAEASRYVPLKVDATDDDDPKHEQRSTHRHKICPVKEHLRDHGA